MKIILSFINVGLVFVYAIGSGLWVNTGDGFYRSLKRPFWQPPDFVFGIAWPYNFLVLIIAGIVIANNSGNFSKITYSILFALSVATALLWAHSFYIQHNLLLAWIALLITALLTIPMVMIAFQTQIWVGVILLPYLLWLFTATSLSVGYYWLN
jgi:tryptophan-rich sensory protein